MIWFTHGDIVGKEPQRHWRIFSERFNLNNRFFEETIFSTGELDFGIRKLSYILLKQTCKHK